MFSWLSSQKIIAGSLDSSTRIVAEVAQAVLAEHGDLLKHVAGVVELGEGRGEEAVPEQRHLLCNGGGGTRGGVGVDRRLVSLLERRLDLLAPGAEAGASEQVRHQLKIGELSDVGTTNRHTRTSFANAG